MSIEKALADNTAAIIALTAAIAANGGTAAAKPAADKPAATKPAAGKNKPAAKPEAPAGATKAQMQAALNEVKEALGTDAARAIITDHGFQKMGEITEDQYQSVYDSAKAAIEPQAAPGADLEDDGL